MNERTSEERLFFDEHQWATVEAAMARIIPTDDSPGAREANTVGFIDRYLSGIEYVYAKPDGSGFEELTGRRAEAWRKRINILQEKYVEGIREMDRRGRERFGEDFAKLTEEQQDEVLSIMDNPKQEAELVSAQVVVGYGAPVEPAMQQTSTEIEIDFFPLLALHTRQGFYSDPIYGGNRYRVVWNLIGFEGPELLAEFYEGRYTTLPVFDEEGI